MKLRFDIKKFLNPTFYAGEDGAPVGAESVSQVEDEFGVGDFDGNEEFYKMVAKNDPDFEQVSEADDSEPEEKDQDDLDPSESSEDNDEQDDDEYSDENPGDDEDSTDDNTEDDEDSGDSEDERFEFEDDVIPGVKGEHLKNIPVEAQEAIGKYVSEYSEAKQNLEKGQARLDALLKDPYVRYRAQLIDSGNSNQSISQEVYDDHIVKGLKERLGLSDDEVKELESVTKEAAERHAQVVIHNDMSESQKQAQAEKAVEESNKIVSSMAEFFPELSVDETDFRNFYRLDNNGNAELNKDHPEFEKWEKGQRDFIEWLREKGISRHEIIRRGRASLAAQYAEDRNKPFALNAKERDAQIRKNLRKSSLSPLLKKSGGKGLSSQSSNTDQGLAGNSKRVMKGGFDIMRLATDDSYFDAALEKNPGSIEHINKLEKLREEGFSLSEKRANK